MSHATDDPSTESVPPFSMREQYVSAINLALAAITKAGTPPKDIWDWSPERKATWAKQSSAKVRGLRAKLNELLDDYAAYIGTGGT
jgi:hypothetical protein